MSQEYLIGLLFWFVLITVVVLVRVFLPLIRYRLHRAAAAPPLWVLRNYLRRTGVYRDYVDSRSEMAAQLMEECYFSLDEALLKLDELEMLGELVYDRSGRWVITNDQNPYSR